ncbi:MAG TPA: AmmeMemoRadiSam system radical SAM enzyme, partial [Myxococcota bacterium]|nr:AmmeMemoRadiSam system radical SAM enzyme [Myxococcota bacterium]
PDYKLTSPERTPAATLTRARRIAQSYGLHYVYTGNVHDTTGGTTSCPGCGHAVIARDWYELLAFDLTVDPAAGPGSPSVARCGRCAT